MNKGTRTAAIIAIVVILVASATALIVASDENEPWLEPTDKTYSIEYVLDGGTAEGNPTEYTAGETVEISSPVKEDYVFAGWYLDPDHRVYFEGITPETTGDLTLYAAWDTSLEGHGFTLKVEGQVNDGVFNSYTIQGEVSYRYLYYDEENDRYYMNLARDLQYNYRYTSYSTNDEKNYWNDESSSEYTVTQEVNEPISTVNGMKDCEVYVLTYEDGSVEKQWIGDGWIPYVITYSQSGFFSSTSITYTFVKELEFVPDVRCDIVAYAEDGITVTGGGTFNPGDKVTLTASGDVFIGWYDDDGDLVYRDPTYTFTVGGSDVTLFAMNSKETDIIGEKDVQLTLSAGADVDSAIWYVLDISGDVIATSETVTLNHTFTSSGEYTILMDGMSGDSEVHRFWTVSVNGDTALTYTWMYSGKQYTITLYIDYSDYKYYRDLTPVSERCQESTHVRDKQFVTYNDKYVLQLASSFKNMTSGMTDLQRMNFLLAFTQYIEYQSDDVFTGYEEYWKYPVETLYDQGGDCEDTSILFSAIAEAMGYNTSLLLFPGHMAAGVDLASGTGNVYFPVDGYKFYYCETTATGYSVGVKPSNVPNTATVVKICSNN